MANTFDTPEGNDNRAYSYEGYENEDRKEYGRIVDLVTPNSKVVDLGCGNGVLLERLIQQKNIHAFGMEISESAVSICRQKKLNVSLGRIDEMLPFNDNEFDYAICNVTIQMVMYPERLLREMKRVAQRQIISFPNFAFWKNRIDLLFRGRMPHHALFGYPWYATGHIHQLSINDFKGLLNTVGDLKIVEQQYADDLSSLKNIIADSFPNLFHLVPIYLLEKETIL